MGKMTSALILVFAIEIALSIFMVDNTTHSALYNFLVNPNFYGTDAWFGEILSQITAIAAASVIVAGLFYFLRIEVIYAGLVIIMYAFMKNIIRLWSTIDSVVQVSPPGNHYVAALICTPLLIFYIMACLDYIRSPTG